MFCITSQIYEWGTPEDFIEKVARRSGKLLKGGEPDINTVCKYKFLNVKVKIVENVFYSTRESI